MGLINRVWAPENLYQSFLYPRAVFAITGVSPKSLST